MQLALLHALIYRSRLYNICTLAHTDRIAETREPATVDYTGQIRSFSEIGPSGPDTTPHPWLCYMYTDPSAQWQTPS